MISLLELGKEGNEFWNERGEYDMSIVVGKIMKMTENPKINSQIIKLGIGIGDIED